MYSDNRQGKSLAGLAVIKYCLATDKALAIGTANVDALYNRIKFEYPNANVSKRLGYVLIENSKNFTLDTSEYEFKK
jgi:hypothetical protein